MTIRVLLVDDQPLVRSGLRTLIEDEPDLDVVGEAGTGGDAIRLAQQLRPDVAVMDIRMPGTDGIAATAAITAAGGPTRVLVLTTFDEDEYVYGALRAGAAGSSPSSPAGRRRTGNRGRSCSMASRRGSARCSRWSGVA